MYEMPESTGLFGENQTLPENNLPRVYEMIYIRCSVYCKRIQLVRLPKHLASRRKHWYSMSWNMYRYKKRKLGDLPKHHIPHHQQHPELAT
jgi:hypothetical protein